MNKFALRCCSRCVASAFGGTYEDMRLHRDVGAPNLSVESNLPTHMSEIAVLDRCNHFRVERVYVHQAHKLVTARRRNSRGALMKKCTKHNFLSLFYSQ